jgi:cadmium resistance protein CadD (predicted permease)
MWASSVFRIALLAAVAFVAANLDDLFLLVGFFSDPVVRPGRVIAGQYLGSGILVLTSLLCSALTVVMPKNYLRVLGLLPILIGLKDLAHRYSSDDKPSRSGRDMLGVTAVALSCGTDNIAVYVPLFADRSSGQNGVTVLVFAAMVGLWCGTAYWLVNHKKMGRLIRHWGPAILPWVLISLGLAIVFNVEAS